MTRGILNWVLGESGFYNMVKMFRTLRSRGRGRGEIGVALASMIKKPAFASTQQ